MDMQTEYFTQSESMTKRALVVEDSDDIVEVIANQLEELGIAFDRAADGERGVTLALSRKYDFILLDIALPKLEGVEVCKRIRECDKGVPIMMLTARNDQTTEVLMLELGADDFVKKPFEPLQLKARVKALLRRGEARSDFANRLPSIRYKDLEIDFERRRVSLRGTVVDLTAREFDILALLASRPGHPHTRSELNEGVYGTEVTGYDKSVTTHINRLRRKLENDPSVPVYIKTSRGFGYYFPTADE